MGPAGGENALLSWKCIDWISDKRRDFNGPIIGDFANREWEGNCVRVWEPIMKTGFPL